jgi:hypothetical protein
MKVARYGRETDMTPIAIDAGRLIPLGTPATIGDAASATPPRLGVAPRARLAHLMGLGEDIALITLAVYVLPLAILLVTTPIGLLIQLVLAAVRP